MKSKDKVVDSAENTPTKQESDYEEDYEMDEEFEDINNNDAPSNIEISVSPSVHDKKKGQN